MPRWNLPGRIETRLVVCTKACRHPATGKAQGGREALFGKADPIAGPRDGSPYTRYAFSAILDHKARSVVNTPQYMRLQQKADVLSPGRNIVAFFSPMLGAQLLRHLRPQRLESPEPGPAALPLAVADHTFIAHTHGHSPKKTRPGRNRSCQIQ